MMRPSSQGPSRRLPALAALAVLGFLVSSVTRADDRKLKVGLMLPATGTYAVLGQAITNGFKLAISERGGKLGGREVDIIAVDDESDPAKAPENTNKLLKRDQVDVLVGTVHSGVALAMAKIARETGTLLIDPNAGADELTGPLCSPGFFRTSFSNWQPAFAMGKVAADRKHKTAITVTWKYTAGEQSANGFKDGFEKGGGKVVKQLAVPFPDVEFQALLTDIAASKPDAVYAFFSGGGAAKFVKDYAAAGLKDKIPLYGPGFLTDGLLEAQGAAADGLLTTLHYADGLGNKRDDAFRAAYKKAYGIDPDVFAVQGYDAAQLLDAGLLAVGGDAGKRAELIKAMESARIDSPRGSFVLSKAHNPVQDIYLRKVEGGKNKLVDVAIKGLADPAKGCKL